MFQRLRQVDWTFLLACVAWCLLSLLMLYVKLMKKSDAFPVLILISTFLLYMNAGDLFKSFKLYAIACVNRRTLAHQFVSATVMGFLSRSYADIIAILIGSSAIVARSGWDIGKSSIPFIGPWLIHPRRVSLVALGVAAQCFGFFTGSVLSMAMISDAVLPHVRVTPSADNYSVVIAFAVGLLGSKLIPSGKLRGKIQTIMASALIASATRILSPLMLVLLFAVGSELFPAAVTGVTTFIPQLVRIDMSLRSRLRAAITVIGFHVTGALIGVYISAHVLGSAASISPDFLSHQGIAHEFFFSAFIGMVASASPRLGPVVALAGCLATGGSAQLISAVSLGNGQIARVVWQTMGSLTGATLLTQLLDSDKVDFDPITSVTRTTDGRKLVENRSTGR